MKIDKVKNYIKVADFKLNDNAKHKIALTLTDAEEIKLKKTCIIYLITVNKEIMKIGKTESQNGIKGRLQGYVSVTSEKTGHTDKEIHKKIGEVLKEGKKVEVYAIYLKPIFSKPIERDIQGLTDSVKMKFNPYACLESEEKCIYDYRKANKKLPAWNPQENRRKDKYWEEYEKNILNKA